MFCNCQKKKKAQIFKFWVDQHKSRTHLSSWFFSVAGILEGHRHKNHPSVPIASPLALSCVLQMCKLARCPRLFLTCFRVKQKYQVSAAHKLGGADNTQGLGSSLKLFAHSRCWKRAWDWDGNLGGLADPKTIMLWCCWTSSLQSG